MRDFVFIDDVVDAVFATVQRPATQVRCLSIGSGIATTIHGLAREIAAICLNGSASSPNYLSNQAITHMYQTVP